MIPPVPNAAGDMLVGVGKGALLDWTTKPFSTALTSIHTIGDSNTIGSVNGTVGAWRMPFYQQLRDWRDDFDMVGSIIDAPEFLSSFGAWYHSATSGIQIAGETALYAAQAAIAGNANIIVDMLGTNNIVVGGQNEFQMLAERQALNAEYWRVNPEAKIVIVLPPPFVAGTTVGGNLAAWNQTRSNYFRLLLEYVNKTDKVYMPTYPVLGNGDFITDGVHLTEAGQAKLGIAIAQYIDGVMLGPRRNGVYTFQSMRERAPRYALSTAVGAADRIVSAPDATFGPSASSFAMALDYYTTTLSAGETNVFSYGATGNIPNYFQLTSQLGALTLYWQSAVSRFAATQPAERTIQAAKWHRIVLIAFLNGANSSLGLYVNGRLVGLLQGVAAWGAFTAQSLSMGLSSDFAGNNDSFYSRYKVYKGANIPKPGGMTALRAVEADYYQAAALFDGNMTASYELDNSVNGDISGSPALVLAGGAAFTAPYAPTGGGITPKRPWEMPQWL